MPCLGNGLSLSWRSKIARSRKNSNKIHSRRYKNNRLGDFLKELDLTEGRCTGIPTIQDELAKNGSPRASIETDEERSYFLMFIPVHEGCGNVVKLNDKTEELPSKLPSNCPKVARKTLETIIQMPDATSRELSEQLGLSERTVRNHLSSLKKVGLIIRIGSDKAGYWQVLIDAED